MINDTSNQYSLLAAAGQQKVPNVEPPTDTDISKFAMALSNAEQGTPIETKLWRIRLLALLKDDSVKQVGMSEALNKFQADQTTQRKLAEDVNTVSSMLR